MRPQFDQAKLARIRQALDQALARGRLPSVRDFADAIEIPKSTLRRYIDHLIERDEFDDQGGGGWHALRRPGTQSGNGPVPWD